MQLLDARFVRYRWERIGRAGRRLGRGFAARTVHLVHLRVPGVIGLHVFVGNGPGRGDAVVVLELAEVLLAQTVERRTIHLSGATDKVVDAGLEGVTVFVMPEITGTIAFLDEHFFGAPVLGFAPEPVAAFEYEDALTRRRQVVCQRPAART